MKIAQNDALSLSKGYKQTEVGLIPSDWEVKTLGNVGEVKMCRRIFNNETSPNGTIPFFKIGTFGKEPDAYISKEQYDEYRKRFSFPRKGDILISAAGTIGRTIIYNGEDAYFQDSNIVWIENNFETVSNEFLYHIYQIANYNTEGGTIQRLYNSILKATKFKCPTKAEQTAIATALSDADALISSLEKLIAKKRNIKQGAMQKLLQPKEGWEVKKLGEVLGRVTTGKLDANAMKENGEYRFYTCAKDYYFIDEYAFDTEALLVSGNGANVGYIHYYKGKFNAYQRTYVLTDFSIDVFYIKLYLDSYLKDRITTEVSAGNTPYIKMDTITDMVIHYPSNVEEQTRIATILSDMDAEISALETKLEKYKKVKLGMMQNLLTGKIRLI